MKNSNIIIEINQRGFRVTATLIHLPAKGVYACKAIMKQPKPLIMQTIYINDKLYPSEIEAIKRMIIGEMNATRETLLTK